MSFLSQVQTFAANYLLPLLGNGAFTTPSADEHGRTLTKSDISDDVPKASIALGPNGGAGVPGNSVQSQPIYTNGVLTGGTSGVSGALPSSWLTGAASPWVSPTPLTIIATINSVVKTYTASSAHWASTSAAIAAINTALGGSYAYASQGGALVVNTGALSLSVGAGTGNALLGWPTGGLGAIVGRSVADYATEVSPTFQPKTAQPPAGVVNGYGVSGQPLACFRELLSAGGGTVVVRNPSQMPTATNPAGASHPINLVAGAPWYEEIAAIVSSTATDVVGIF